MAGQVAAHPHSRRANPRSRCRLQGRYLSYSSRSRCQRHGSPRCIFRPSRGSRTCPPHRGDVRSPGGRRDGSVDRDRGPYSRTCGSCIEVQLSVGDRMTIETTTSQGSLPTEPEKGATRKQSMLVKIATDRPRLLILLIAALLLIMTVLEPGTFMRPANAAVVLLDTAQTGILACGMMVLMIAGMFDLSIGGILAFSGIIAGLAAKTLGLPPAIAFACGCLFGMLLGAINGLLVTRFKINALIATLATLSVYRGGLQLVSGAGVTNIGNNFTMFGQTQILGIYSPFWFMAVIVTIFMILVGRTRYFRQAYYIGGNPRAAKLSGISVEKTVFTFFVIMGFLSGLAGALLASRLNTAVVLAGQGVELKVITAVVLGGASLSGGVGTFFGAVLGVLFMALLQNAMIVAGINPFWQLIVVGIVLLISVGLDQFARIRSRM